MYTTSIYDLTAYLRFYIQKYFGIVYKDTKEMLVQHSLERSKAFDTLLQLCTVYVKKQQCIRFLHLDFHNYVLFNNVQSVCERY
jgi:hypothetical protein